MPYIKPDRRIYYDALIEEFDRVTWDDVMFSPGDLNYILTRILHTTIIHCGKSYDTLNALIGVLECCKLELYRRIAAPYEDKKIKENGDVA